MKNIATQDETKRIFFLAPKFSYGALVETLSPLRVERSSLAAMLVQNPPIWLSGILWL